MEQIDMAYDLVLRMIRIGARIDMEGAFRVNIYRNSPIGQDMANQTLETNQTLKTNQTNIDSDKRLAISDLTEPEKQIIEIIKKQSDCKQKEIAKWLNWIAAKVKYHMARMVESGTLAREGTNRKGGWIINKL